MLRGRNFMRFAAVCAHPNNTPGYAAKRVNDFFGLVSKEAAISYFFSVVNTFRFSLFPLSMTPC
jgi:hypothetical protein